VNKWFRKQYRTAADAELDEMYPDRTAADPPDQDTDSQGKPIKVAPPEIHTSEGQSGETRPLKGGYWFIRPMYRDEVAEAIRVDKDRFETTKRTSWRTVNSSYAEGITKVTGDRPVAAWHAASRTSWGPIHRLSSASTTPPPII
jgi:hypothetical protein